MFNRKAGILTLNRNVVLKSSSGFEMHLDEAVVDTGSGEVVSNKPVAVFTQDATLNADRLEVDEVRRDRPLHRRRGHEPEWPRRSQATGSGHGQAMSTEADHGGALLAAFMAAAMPCALAQPGANSGKTAPNALQGFQQNRGQPVQIEAASLEVRDKDKVATFTGNVKVVQGDTTMRCKSLVVFYEQQDKDQQRQAAAQTMKAATPGPGGSSQISRLEASGGVTVTQKDQTATGDTRAVRHEVQHRDAAGQCAWSARARTSCAASGWWSISPPACRASMPASERAGSHADPAGRAAGRVARPARRRNSGRSARRRRIRRTEWTSGARR